MTIFYPYESGMKLTPQKRSLVACVAAVTPILAILGAIEVALVFALRAAKDRSLDWPIILMAVLGACLLAAGVLRHYWDIYVHRTVRGISFIFVGIDAAGDLFSLVSVCTFSMSVNKDRLTKPQYAKATSRSWGWSYTEPNLSSGLACLSAGSSSTSCPGPRSVQKSGIPRSVNELKTSTSTRT